jgi:mannose-1-phosphate guanylyltransferase
MRAMVMAAGLGTRLRPLTETLPKPIAPVGNRPVVEHLLRQLATAGVDEAVMNLHWHPEAVQDVIGDGSAYGVPVTYSIEEELLGTAGGTRRCLDRLLADDDCFLVTSGDGLHGIDLAAVVEAHRASGALATIVVKPLADITGFGVIVADPSGRVTSFQEKPAPADALSDLVNVGVYCFDRAIAEEIPPSGPSDFGSEILPRLVAEGRAVHAHRTTAYWSDVGSLDELVRANLAVVRGDVACHLQGRMLQGPGISGPVLVDAGAQIDDDVVITGPTVIGRGAHIGAGARIASSLILPGAQVAEGALVERTLIGAERDLSAIWS